ncbi:hypothetical protein CR513_39361, partial [Mucuna pruriens]
MLTRRGIEANLEKYGVVVNMKSLKSIKGMQQLAGQITGLDRFLSRSTEKDTPIFQCLRKAKQFKRIDECETDFQELKTILASPHLNKRSKRNNRPGDRWGPTPSIFCQQGAETHYQKIDKAALVVIITNRKLRSYFNSHPIVVKINLPIKQILRKPDLAGRISVGRLNYPNLTSPLKERGISKLRCWQISSTSFPGSKIKKSSRSKGRGAKAEEQRRELTLSVDGSSNQKGSGAGIILEGQRGTSNNQVEYEALLVGMRLAKEVGAKVLIAKSDSQLTIPQLSKGSCWFMSLAIIQEALSHPTIEVAKDPTINFPEEDQVLGDRQEAKKVRREALKYMLVIGQLYKQGFSYPLLKCLGEDEVEHTIREVHKGACGTHIKGRALVGKITQAGFYWPTLKKDCLAFVKKCDKCQ